MHSKLSFKLFLLKLTAFFISVVLSLIASEISVRLIPEKKPLCVEHPFSGPFLCRVIRCATGDFEYHPQKGRNVFKIIMADDSFRYRGNCFAHKMLHGRRREDVRR